MHKIRPSSAVYRAVNAPTTKQRRIGRVYNRVDLQLRYVGLNRIKRDWNTHGYRVGESDLTCSAIIVIELGAWCRATDGAHWLRPN